MGKAAVKYREIRFVIEDELTQVYVACEALGDCPLGVQGWHHKTFPPSIPVDGLLKEMFKNDGPILWPQKSPEESRGARA